MQLLIANIMNMIQMAAFGDGNSGAVKSNFYKKLFMFHYINAEDDEIIKI